MKFHKAINGKEDLVICCNSNLFSLYEREGYKEVEEVVEDPFIEELREQAKELGIKGFHVMKKETLISKIAELK